MQRVLILCLCSNSVSPVLLQYQINELPANAWAAVTVATGTACAQGVWAINISIIMSAVTCEAVAVHTHRHMRLMQHDVGLTLDICWGCNFAGGNDGSCDCSSWAHI